MTMLNTNTHLECVIYLIRGHKVMFDADLAALYGVTTKRLNEQVKRNKHRFPDRYMFQLDAAESQHLRSQNATSSEGHGGRRHLPFVFTEHGAIMLASVLNSKTAIQASIAVVDAFVRLREMVLTTKDLSRKLAHLEARYDSKFRAVFEAIRELMRKPIEQIPRPIKITGFARSQKESRMD